MAELKLLDEIIIHEILIRLPIKSLVRFRCVCKSWKSLLYNHVFVSQYDQNPNIISDSDDYIMCISYYYDKPRSLSILSHNNFSETHLESKDVVPNPTLDLILLIGSINGLVCMALYNKESCMREFVIWNPVIRVLKKIIVPKYFNMNHRCLYLYGFGWDSVTDDYKLIIAKTKNTLRPAVVYSCKTDCWSKAPPLADTISLLNYPKPPSVIVKGFPYWSTHLDNNTNILKFDIRNNEFTYIKVPFRYGIHTYSLINHNDCLEALTSYGFKEITYVYRFDEKDSVWVKIDAIDREIMSKRIKPLCFKYGGVVFNKKKQLFDPESHTIKDRPRGSCALCVVGSPYEFKCHYCGGFFSHGYSYTPSLLTLPGMKTMQRSEKITC